MQRFSDIRILENPGKIKAQYTAFDFSDYLTGSEGGIAARGLFFLRIQDWDVDDERPLGKQDDRISAIQAMAEWGDLKAFTLIENELKDRYAPSPVRRAAAIALGSCDSAATATLLNTLSDSDLAVRTPGNNLVRSTR